MRFAYLFLVHKVTETLETALRMIDDPRNDIFIHVDAKTKDFPFERVQLLAKKSGLFFLENRINVAWGGYQQIEAELALIKAAAGREHYGYYHLLSGEDLPLKGQNEIHRFFEESGGEYVQFCREYYDCPGRTDWYYVFPHSFRSPNTLKTIPQKIVNKSLLLLQKVTHFRRNQGIDFQKGANWFSITDDLANYVLAREMWIRKVFHHSYCCDEVFLQTLILNSEFRKRLAHPAFDDAMEANMRFILWNEEDRSPRTLTMDDLPAITASGMLFGRKFNARVDGEVIREIARTAG